MGSKTETKSKPKNPKSNKQPKEEKPLSLKKEAQKEFTKLFLEFYLGWHGGEAFSNATWSYLLAKGYDMDTVKELCRPLVYEQEEAVNGIDTETGEEKLTMVKRKAYHPTYTSAKTEGWKLLTKPDTRKLKVELLNNYFKDKNAPKNRHAELAMQDKNLIVARQANADILKMTGDLEDKQTVNIPQLMELTDKIGGILKKK